MTTLLNRLKVFGPILFVSFVVVALIFVANNRTSDQSKPDIAVVRRIEYMLVLPHQARPLSSYIRYYSQEIIQGKEYIVATFLYNASPGRIELVAAKKRPVIEDGGCDVIELRYSIADNQIISFACNGLG